MSGHTRRRRLACPGYRGLMVRRVGAMVLIGVVMAGCLSPGGTVKVDGDEYAKAVKETLTLGQAATELIRDASDGGEGDISAVQSGRCGEPYADNLRQLEMGSSFFFEGKASEAEVVDSVTDGLEELGWNKKQGEDGTYFFEHAIPGGATLRLNIAPSPYTDEPGQSVVRMSFESTCMDIPKDVAAKT